MGIVATGSINAQLALIAAGIRRSVGSKPLAVDTAPSMGISITVVAVLLVISVRKVTSRATHKITKTVSILSMPTRRLATCALRPDSKIAIPRQIPEPTKIIRPQGI